jgi:hypothetical protein
MKLNKGLASVVVVHADPKSRTGQDDRKELVTSCVVIYLFAQSFCELSVVQDHSSWREIVECR